MPSNTIKQPGNQTKTLPASQKIAQVRSLVNTGMSSSDARRQVRSGFTVNIPDSIPSESLIKGGTYSDVLAKRNKMETIQTQKNDINTRISDISGKIGTAGVGFYNPDEALNRLLLKKAPSGLVDQRTNAFNQSVENRKDYASELSTARSEANTQFGLPDMTAALADTRTKYADREAQLNKDLKQFETNALERGVPREYVEAEKNKVKSQALEDLANLSAIEAAQVGSINDARSIINDLMSDKKTAFELENQSIQSEIDYLNTLVGEENAQQAQELQFALNERKANQDKILAQEAAIKGYGLEAAKAGADNGTIQAIFKSATEEEAIRLLAPYVAPKPTEAKTPETKNFGTNDAPIWKQYNPNTGSWEDVSGVDGTSVPGEAKQITESTSKLDALLGYATQAENLSDASGASGISKVTGDFFVGDTKYRRLENLIDTMKVNLLTMNTDPTIKKFFGPQMSNRDTELMTSAGTTLNAEKMSPSDMKLEISAYKDVIKRAKAWTYLGGGGTMTVQLVDPQTGTKEFVPVNYDTLTQAVNDGVLVQF